MSLGARSAGIEVSSAIDCDPWAARTYQKNHKKVDFLESDIRNVDTRIFSSKRCPLILLGGPPCQGYSTSNQKTRNMENEANWMYEEFIRFSMDLKPQIIVFENVKGLLETEKGFFYRKICDRFEKLGYNVDTWLLNAAEFGVPQKRSRLFIVSTKRGRPRKPIGRFANRPITVQEAIGDLPILKNGASMCVRKYRTYDKNRYTRHLKNGKLECTNNLVTRNSDLVLRRYRTIPQGGNWESIPPKLMSNYKDHSRCHTGIYYRLKGNESAVTVGNFRKNMLIHPTQCRGLSVREAARLQSFPDLFHFEGSIGFQQQQVGNAVPPLLAKSVFEALIRCTANNGK